MLTHDGITFTWPDVLAGEPDNVVAMGQTVLVSGSGTTLGFLGASTSPASGTATSTGTGTGPSMGTGTATSAGTSISTNTSTGTGTGTGASGSGKVYYTDGTNSGFQLTLPDYQAGPGAGSDVVAAMPYVNDTSGGKVEQAAFIFYAGVPITAGKTVQAVTLPVGGVSAPGGPVSGMHIFALGIGPLSAQGMPLTGDAS